MKKMVCEICSSQSIRKENGVFVCQECGTEYSLEEAKALLKEVDSEPTDNKPVEKTDSKLIDNKTNKYELLKYLSSWLELVNSFKDSYFWLGADFSEIYSKSSFEDFRNKCINAKPLVFPTFDREYVIKNYIILSSDSPDAEKMERIYGDDILNAFRNNSTLENFKHNCIYYGSNMIYVNGQGPFPEYFVYWNGDYNRGYRLDMVANPCELVFYMIDARKKGTRYGSNHDIVKRGFFGDKITHADMSSTINVNKYLDTVENIYNQILDRHQKLSAFYKDNFESQKANYLSLIESISDLENAFNLPHKYWNITSISSLINYIEDGRVDNWKEAVNLLEQEKHQARMEMKLDAIGTYLVRLNNSINVQLSSINNQLLNISSNISNIAQSINTCAEALTNIMYDTRYSLIRSII